MELTWLLNKAPLSVVHAGYVVPWARWPAPPSCNNSRCIQSSSNRCICGSVISCPKHNCSINVSNSWIILQAIAKTMHIWSLEFTQVDPCSTLGQLAVPLSLRDLASSPSASTRPFYDSWLPWIVLWNWGWQNLLSYSTPFSGRTIPCQPSS